MYKGFGRVAFSKLNNISRGLGRTFCIILYMRVETVLVRLWGDTRISRIIPFRAVLVERQTKRIVKLLNTWKLPNTEQTRREGKQPNSQGIRCVTFFR